MLDLTSFSDLLSRLNPGIPFAIPADPQTAESAPEAPRSPQADVLDLSSIQSNNSGSSFDRVPVEDAGVYQPATVQAGGFMHFGLNLSIERQAVYTSNGGGGRAVFQALESASLSYQSEFAAGRNTLGGSFGEVRSYQMDLFYSRSRELSVQLGSELGDRMESTGRRVARSFEVDISLEVSFLGQFTNQSEAISGLDLGLFESYLDGTDAAAGQSGSALQAFFDEVSDILDQMESRVQDSLASFFEEVKATFGLSDAEGAALQAQVAGEISAFFFEVDSFLNDMSNALMESGGAEEVPDELEAALV